MKVETNSDDNYLFKEEPVAFAIEFTKNACQNCALIKDLKACSACHLAKYCSVKCQKKHWKTHKHECHLVQKKKFPLENPFMLIYRCLLMVKLGKFPEYNHFEMNLDKIKDEIDSSFLSRLVFVVNVCFEHYFTIEDAIITHAIIQTNNFAITSEITDIIGYGIFKTGSKIDHSCYPNVEYAFCGTEAKFYKTMPDDTTNNLSDYRITYVDLFDDFESRKKRLSETYHFQCDCIRCTDGHRIKAEKIMICCGHEKIGTGKVDPKLICDLAMVQGDDPTTVKCTFCGKEVKSTWIDHQDLSNFQYVEKAFSAKKSCESWIFKSRNPFNIELARIINSIMFSLESAPLEELFNGRTREELGLIILKAFDWIMESFIPNNIPPKSAVQVLFLEFLMKFSLRACNEYKDFYLLKLFEKYQYLFNDLVDKKDVRVFTDPYIKETFLRLYTVTQKT